MTIGRRRTRLLRLLTPLLKFRACRDARRATGDAMEMRGGSGCIEEWPDARLLRDAHLGSIWEGTSSIVALDVMRAIRKEGALQAYTAELDALEASSSAGAQDRGADAGAHAQARRAARLRAEHFAREVAELGDEAHARQAASGLYHAAAATLLAWEGQRIGGDIGAERAALARLVVAHKLLPRDPLARTESPAPG